MTIPLNEENTEDAVTVTIIGLIISPFISGIINIPSYINGTMSLYCTIGLFIAMWVLFSIMFIIGVPIWYLVAQIREN